MIVAKDNKSRAKKDTVILHHDVEFYKEPNDNASADYHHYYVLHTDVTTDLTHPHLMKSYEIVFDDGIDPTTIGSSIIAKRMMDLLCVTVQASIDGVVAKGFSIFTSQRYPPYLIKEEYDQTNFQQETLKRWSRVY
jgi:hypothetical protein